MIIGYDGKRAIQNNTGLGNYSRLLVELLAREYPDNSYRLYAPRLTDNPRMKPLLELPNGSVATPQTGFGHRFPALWRTGAGITAQMRRDGIGLFHGLSGELPLNIASARVPSVVTIHDIIFRRCPATYALPDRLIYDYKFRTACRNATRIMAISECTRRDIVNDYGIDPEKIDVVYQGCDAQFHRTPDAAEIARVKALYGIIRPYIICVGSVEERKNQIMAVRGLRDISSEFDLVIVGRRTAYARTIDSFASTYGLTDRVKFIENALFSHLPALYAGAFCSSYTSRYEGFGIPVIESLSVGTPVVVATGSCLEEAGGPHTPAVDPDDVEQWIFTIREMINYPDVRKKIAEAGRQYVQRFNNTGMAQGVMECYRRAIRDYGNN